MCGIVGLFLKNPDLEPELGRHTAVMLDVLADRGPDSTGFAIYTGGATDRVKLTLRAAPGCDFTAVARALTQALGTAVPITVHADHAVITVPAAQEAMTRAHLATLSA